MWIKTGANWRFNLNERVSHFGIKTDDERTLIFNLINNDDPITFTFSTKEKAEQAFKEIDKLLFNSIIP